MWLEASSLSPDLKSVQRWPDLTGKVDAIQMDGARQPSVVRGVLKGQPVVRFDGKDDILRFDMPLNGLRELSLVLVSATRELVNLQRKYGYTGWCRGTAPEAGCSATQNGPLFWDEAQYGDYGVVALLPRQTQVTMYFGQGKWCNGVYPARWTYAKPVGDRFVSTMAVHSPTASTLFVDGEKLKEFKPCPDSTIKKVNPKGMLGGSRLDTYWPGDIAAVLVYHSALDNERRAALDAYFKCRYF